MTTSAYSPYLSEAARDLCFAYLDSLAARQWLIASEDRTVPTSYGPTFVRIGGPAAAPALVLLHGAGATSLMWAPNIQALSAVCRTYAIDQIGEFGKSVCTRPAGSLRDLLAWLDELFDALDLHSGIALAGMSYGGALAAQYALHAPGRLDRLILLAPGATVLRPPAQFWARLVIVAANRRRGLPAFFRWIFADMERRDPQWVEETLAQLFLNMRSLQRHRPPFPPVLTDAEWASLKPPALFLAGEREVIYSAQKAVRRLKRVAPQVAAEIVPAAGHDFTFAHAAEVNQRVLEFLKQPPYQTAGNTLYRTLRA